MSRYPAVVALDLDWTLWGGYLDPDKWGRGFRAEYPPEDNIEGLLDDLICDKSNTDNHLRLFPDVADIIADILKHGARIAIVSRNRNKAMTDRALWHLKIWHPQRRRMVSITDVIDYNEVYDSPKVEHFRQIKAYAGVEYRDMILFDDESRNNTVEIELGVTFKACRHQRGLTWQNYDDGIDMWRLNKTLVQVSLPVAIGGRLPDRSLFVGYCGTRTTTFRRLEKGLRRIDQTRPARWGFGLYVSDNPGVAKFFADSVRDEGYDTVVCRIYARDRAIFEKVPKIWVPEVNVIQTHNWGATDEHEIGETQADRDDWIRSCGIAKPYILFSKHHRMTGMPIPGNTRFNEMAIYPQLQDSLFFAVGMRPGELEQDMRAWDRGWQDLRYDKSVDSWGITVPLESRVDVAFDGDILS